MNTAELRARLNGLETDAERTGAAVIAAETAHTFALRRAVETGDHAPADKTQAALDAARRAHARATALTDEARDLLTRAVRRERDAVREAARAEIEAELADMAETARGLDTAFAALTGQIVRLRDRETELHRKARDRFRAPWQSPLTLSAARLLSSYLTARANGLSPELKPFIAETIESATANIRSAYNVD